MQAMRGRSSRAAGPAGHRWAWTQERERIINPLVQHVSAALKWSAASDHWNLLGFECIPGDHANYSPGSPDISKVVNALLHLQDIACPDGIEVKRAEDRWGRLHEDTGAVGRHQPFCIPNGLQATSWSPTVRASLTGHGPPAEQHGSTQRASPSG
jgi:hypothetical protein